MIGIDWHWVLMIGHRLALGIDDWHRLALGIDDWHCIGIGY
jgi:hypothetical protein